MPLVTVHELLEAGMHYGHHVSRWNPKMAPFIFGRRNLIHIINLRETIRGLVTACKFVTHVTATGKKVVFVGTKRQARRAVCDEATRCGMPYVIERWLGGTLTNFRTIRSRLERLGELESIIGGPAFERYPKKEGSRMKRELAKIRRNLEGIREMEQLPGVVIVVDPRREKIAIAEANRLNIPTVCLADTDCDPDAADVLIPGNDDAMRSVSVVMRCLADAALAGKEKRLALARAEAAEAVKAAAAKAKTEAQADKAKTDSAPESPTPEEKKPDKEKPETDIKEKVAGKPVQGNAK